MLIKHWLHQAKTRLDDHSNTSALDAEVLLAHVLNKSRTYLYTWPDNELTHDIIEVADALVDRRQTGEPVAYLTGHREFWSLPLATNPSTLIPRPDTELLVEWALALLAKTPQPNILDLGTGSGAIALALASERPDARVYGVDVSFAACALANHNKSNLQLSNCYIAQGAWLNAIQPTATFDLIVSNPPYIPENDSHLSQGDVRFEPASALISGKDGLNDIHHIAQHAKAHLVRGGCLLLEHGYNQQTAVAELLHRAGYEHIQCKRDLANNPRATLAQLTH